MISEYISGHRKGVALALVYQLSSTEVRLLSHAILQPVLQRPEPSLKYLMAMINATAPTADVDSIAAIDNHDHPTKLPPPNSTINTIHTDEHLPHLVEELHLDESNVTVRTKIRTLAIVLALYVVLFIAALDQTIIA